MPSPKRKSQVTSEHDDGEVSKKPRTSDDDDVVEDGATTPNAAPDSLINHENAIKYWSGTEATVNGVLGGYPQVSRIDLQGSANFFAKLRRQSKKYPTGPTGRKLRRAVDCGAGIGRITAGFLSNIAETVDIVEPVKSFTDQIKGKDNVGEVYNVGLESWHPDKDGLGPYDLIWNQWCVGQLTDAQLVKYLKRLPSVLSEGGWIIVKENLSNHQYGEDVFDETDSSVSRTDVKFRKLFEEAELKLVSTELQKGFPKGLYPVRSYALQPR